MLTQEEITRKLHDYAFEFRALMKRRQYEQAKIRYDKAVWVAVFVELPQNEKDKLFGIRGEKGTIIQQGEFPEELVQKAFEMTVVRAERSK